MGTHRVDAWPARGARVSGHLPRRRKEQGSAPLRGGPARLLECKR